MKILISKLLISAAVVFHCYLLLFDQVQSRRLQRNLKNNISNRLGPYLPDALKIIFEEYMPEFIIAMMLCSIPMVISTRKEYKICTLLGIVLYNLLNLHHRVIIPNYYCLRDWLAICGAIIFLLAVDGIPNVRVKRRKSEAKKYGNKKYMNKQVNDQNQMESSKGDEEEDMVINKKTKKIE